MTIEERLSIAKELMKIASPTQRISLNSEGYPILIETGVVREDIERNMKMPKLSKNACRCLAKHHETHKNNRFARDQDFG